MARYMPPGYKKVRRKVAPAPAVRSQVPQETQNILQKQKELADAVAKQAAGTADPAAEEAAANKAAEKDAKKQATKAKRAAAKKTTKKVAKKTTKKVAKKATKKVAKKAAKAKKFPKWSPDDNRDKLYKLAKKLDLDSVNSRDTKDWIIKQLKKAEKKASK